MRASKGSSNRVRVTIQQSNGTAVTVKIEGKIAGIQVPELHRAWQELAATLRTKRLLVDLRGVTHVDGTGLKLLAEIHEATGAEFLAETPLTKYFADEARQGIRSRSEL
jgi:anti-anti-sigma factor